MKGKLIQLQNSLNTKFKELKAKIEATNTDLKGKIQASDSDLRGKIANIEATDADLQRKIDTGYTQLEGKIDAGDAELKNNLSFAIPNYNELVEGKYTDVRIIFQLLIFLFNRASVIFSNMYRSYSSHGIKQLTN